MNKKSFTVRQAFWDQDRPALRMIRETVFVQEQQVPIELEWDDNDQTAVHILATDKEGAPIGTGRLLVDGQIGRMAVLNAYRGKGVGGAILEQLLAQGDTCHLTHLFLNAQTAAVQFYKRYGFHEVGTEFIEAGIPHKRMERDENEQRDRGTHQ